MIINLQVYEVSPVGSASGYFLGESSDLCINSNIPEIASTPIEFYGSSRDSVVDQVKAYARAKFPDGGSIRLV
jgi:hypothetical protein